MADDRGHYFQWRLLELPESFSFFHLKLLRQVSCAVNLKTLTTTGRLLPLAPSNPGRWRYRHGVLEMR